MGQELTPEQKALKALIIETIGSGSVRPEAIDLYGLAQQIHEVFPSQPVEEIALEIAEIAMGQASRAML